MKQKAVEIITTRISEPGNKFSPADKYSFINAISYTKYMQDKETIKRTNKIINAHGVVLSDENIYTFDLPVDKKDDGTYTFGYGVIGEIAAHNNAFASMCVRVVQVIDTLDHTCINNASDFMYSNIWSIYSIEENKGLIELMFPRLMISDKFSLLYTENDSFYLFSMRPILNISPLNILDMPSYYDLSYVNRFPEGIDLDNIDLGEDVIKGMQKKDNAEGVYFQYPQHMSN